MSTMGPHENVFNYQRLMLRRDWVGGSQRDQAQRGRHHQLLQDLHQDSLPGATYSPNFLGRAILHFFNESFVIIHWRSLRNSWAWPNLLRGRGTPHCKCAGRDFCQEITLETQGPTLAISIPSDLASIVWCEGLPSTSSPVLVLEESQKTSGICKIHKRSQSCLKKTAC